MSEICLLMREILSCLLILPKFATLMLFCKLRLVDRADHLARGKKKKNLQAIFGFSLPIFNY